MKFKYIKRQGQGKLSLDATCKALGVSRGGYYKWKESVVQKVQLEHQQGAEIRAAWEASNRTYGAPRIYRELQAEGKPISKHKVAGLMKKQGISGAGVKAYRHPTTDSKHTKEVAERLFKTETTQVKSLTANEVWSGDITYIRLTHGFCYLAVFMDIALRKIVGYSVRQSLHAEGVIDALKMAVGRENPGPGLIVHSDRGMQYACEDYQDLIKQQGFKSSMSRKGNCYDNAFVESFFRSLKVELINRYTFKTIEEARLKIFKYIEVWYNRQRRHSSLGYVCPVEYERSIAKTT